jgi:hypothetical protein
MARQDVNRVAAPHGLVKPNVAMFPLLSAARHYAMM